MTHFGVVSYYQRDIEMFRFYKSSYKMTNPMFLLEIREEWLTLYNLRFMGLLPWLIMSFFTWWTWKVMLCRPKGILLNGQQQLQQGINGGVRS